MLGASSSTSSSIIFEAYRLAKFIKNEYTQSNEISGVKLALSLSQETYRYICDAFSAKFQSF
jgi:hypothetical protein